MFSATDFIGFPTISFPVLNPVTSPVPAPCGPPALYPTAAPSSANGTARTEGSAFTAFRTAEVGSIGLSGSILILASLAPFITMLAKPFPIPFSTRSLRKCSPRCTSGPTSGSFLAFWYAFAAFLALSA